MSGRKTKSRAAELYGADLRPSFSVACVVASLIVHVVSLGAVVFSPWVGQESEWSRPADTINVDLVAFDPELPGPPGQDDSGGSREEPASEPDADAVALDSGKQQDTEDSGEEKPREISVKKGIKKKVSGDYDLKTPSPEKKSPENEETPDPDKVISDAVSRMEREAEKNKPDAVSDRIARLQGEVEGQDYKKRLRENSRQGSGGSGGRSHSGDLSPMEIYQAEVAALMKQNWAFSPDMAGENARGLEARLVIKIMSDGEISDVWFEKRSGNDYLDESAYRTVMKASPLPPLPEGRSRYHLLLGFTPSGLSN